MRALGLGLALLLGGCGKAGVEALGDPSTGANQWVAEECLGCHATLATAWARPSSHRLLLDCNDCHRAFTAAAGPKHETTRECGDCHSARGHRSFGCRSCHDVHGSENLFLVKPVLYGAAVRVTKPEGATAEGLAHDGAGVCETCHTATRYYRSDGGAPHEGGWCVQCHPHREGFTP